jgi:hypothetical protein
LNFYRWAAFAKHGINLAEQGGLNLAERYSNLRINSSAEVTVKDTTGYATGIKVREGSSMLAWGAKLEIKDNKGIDGVGIMVLRNSHVRLAGAGLDAKIFNNDGHGVEIGQNSSGRFDLGTKIYSNRNDGMNINSNSMFYAQGIEVTGNDGRGIAADDGSSVGCNSCTICGNTVDSVALTFGSRGSFYEPKTCPPIPEANCDETVLIRGDINCSSL